jgi:histidinol dehydrogenase
MKLRAAGHYSYFMQEVLYCAQKAGVTHILKAGGAQVE